MSSNRSHYSVNYKPGNLNSKEHRVSANNISRQTGIPENNSNMSSNRHITGSSKSGINSNSGEYRVSTKNISTPIEMKILLEKNEELKIENNSLKNEIELNKSTQKKEYENYKNMFGENQELEERNKKSERTILQLKYENEELKYRSVQSKEYEERFHKLRRKYNGQKNDLNDLKTKLENLEGKHDELEMNYDELKINSGELKRNYELKNKSIILLEKEVDKLENEKNNSIKKIEELEADLQKKQNAVITIRNKYKTLQNTNDELSGLAIFKSQSLTFKKQNEDFKCQLSILTKSNENLNTQLELIKNENNQLKAEIKNLKLLKFTSKPISSISTYNIQDSYNFIDENKMSHFKNEHSTQSFVNNEVESNNKAKHNVNCTESKHFNKFPAWWYNHMNCEISTIQMESTTKENIKSKTNFNNTKSLMFTDASDLQNSDIDNENFQVKNKKSEQTFVNIANKPSRKDENYQMNTNHSNHKYRA